MVIGGSPNPLRQSQRRDAIRPHQWRQPVRGKGPGPAPHQLEILPRPRRNAWQRRHA